MQDDLHVEDAIGLSKYLLNDLAEKKEECDLNSAALATGVVPFGLLLPLFVSDSWSMVS